MLEMGLDTFGDVVVDSEGRPVTQAQALRNVVAEGVFAEQVGVDCFGVGEHHRPDFAVSAPEVVLAAIAGKTQRMLLGSAVTVLSTDDPVRVFQRFSTLDAVSNGRAEVILGRGSFTESYPLFGYDLSQYNELFEEKLDLFVKLLDQKPVTWSGRTRSSLTNQIIYPPSRERAAAHMDRRRRQPRVGCPRGEARPSTHTRDHWRKCNPVHALRRVVPQYSGAVGKAAAADWRPFTGPRRRSPTNRREKKLWPHYAAMMNRIGRERGWPPRGRDDFDREAGPGGALYVGAPETVAAKIVNTVKALGVSRFDLKYSNGTLPHAALMKSIELYGTEVMPRVRREIEKAN